MALDVSELASREPIQGFAVERVDGKAGVRTWAAVVSAAFGIPKSSLEAIFGSARPGYRYFVGRLNGEPVSSASLFVDAKSVGVYWVGAVPAQRGRGFASATIASALRDGADSPRLGVLHATDAATGLYGRLGFSPYAPIGVYVHRPGRQ
jgi:GNAT superfamily N-acetyltransferase